MLVIIIYMSMMEALWYHNKISGEDEDMSIITILALAVGLGMDAFAVAVGISLVLPRLTGRAVFRLAWHFGLFQFMMPVLGWAAGMTVQQWIRPWDHWVAFGLLGWVGGKMIYESRKNHLQEKKNDPTRGVSLIALSVATSIDALAVGLSMAMLEIDIWLPCLIIGVAAAVMTTMGMLLGPMIRQWGRNGGGRFSRFIELTGGIILIGIGVKILVGHLMG